MVVARLCAQHALEQRLAAVLVPAVGADAGEAEQRVLRRDVGVLGAERGVGGVVHEQLVGEPLRVGEPDARVLHRPRHLERGETIGPEPQRGRRCDAPEDAVHHPRADATTRRTRVLEERHIGTRRPPLISIKEVVDRRIVLVDRLRDEAQAEDGGDRGDVVDALEPHVVGVAHRRGPIVVQFFAVLYGHFFDPRRCS